MTSQFCFLFSFRKSSSNIRLLVPKHSPFGLLNSPSGVYYYYYLISDGIGGGTHFLGLGVAGEK